MARITDINLSHGFSGSNVLLIINITIEFQAHETSSNWSLLMTVIPNNQRPDDDEELYTFGRSFQSTDIIQTITFTETISKREVESQWQRQKIYLNVAVIPLQEASSFISATAKTNLILIRV